MSKNHTHIWEPHKYGNAEICKICGKYKHGEGKMDKKEHIRIHKELHKALDLLLADFITHTNKLPDDVTVMELSSWAQQQTKHPTELK